MKYVQRDVVEKVEERISRRWASGTGDKAVFKDHSEGWYAVLLDCHISVHLGTEEPGLRKGDRVRLTLERETAR